MWPSAISRPQKPTAYSAGSLGEGRLCLAGLAVYAQTADGGGVSIGADQLSYRGRPQAADQPLTVEATAVVPNIALEAPANDF